LSRQPALQIPGDDYNFIYQEELKTFETSSVQATPVEELTKEVREFASDMGAGRLYKRKEELLEGSQIRQECQRDVGKLDLDECLD